MKEKKVIAVCGKGGVGKTAFTALLTRVLSEQSNGSLLVVDADPALGLNYALGRTTEKTIGSVRDAILKAAETSNRKEMESLAEKVDYLVAQSLDEGKDFSFLAMGRMDKVGCFCSVNDLLKAALAEVVDQFDVTLIDGEAGLEQINRQVIEHIDTLIIVTDTSFRGFKTVSHIKGLVDEGLIPDCKTIGVVFNRAQSDVDQLQTMVSGLGIKVLGSVPYDKEIEVFDLEGRSLINLPDSNSALRSVRNIYANL